MYSTGLCLGSRLRESSALCLVVSAGGPSSWLFSCRVCKLHPMGVQDWLVFIRGILPAVCHLSSDEGEGNPVHGLSRCRGSLCLYYRILHPVALRLFSSISSPCLFLQSHHSSHIILYDILLHGSMGANSCMSTRPVPVINHSFSDTAHKVKVTAVIRPSIHESHGMGCMLVDARVSNTRPGDLRFNMSPLSGMQDWVQHAGSAQWLPSWIL